MKRRKKCAVAFGEGLEERYCRKHCVPGLSRFSRGNEGKLFQKEKEKKNERKLNSPYRHVE